MQRTMRPSGSGPQAMTVCIYRSLLEGKGCHYNFILSQHKMVVKNIHFAAVCRLKITLADMYCLTCWGVTLISRLQMLVSILSDDITSVDFIAEDICV